MDNLTNIYRILLNRNPRNEELIRLRRLNLSKIKEEIKNSQEFKNFNNQNLSNIKEIISSISGIEDISITNPEYLKKFITLGYNTLEMNKFCSDIINNIKNTYKLTYKNYLDMDEDINDKELTELINNPNNIENYICISDKFLQKSEEKFRLLYS